MIGRGYLRSKGTEEADSRGFDAFELRLGDLMRGERATMGKSLLDVQRELKIKAAYIAAIENADPSAFDTPGFIAGYVRSYARYLNMDPDWAFETFCRESGFSTPSGAPVSSGSRGPREEKVANSGLGKELFAVQGGPFLPANQGFLSNVEPRAVGSVLVLVALLSGLGYGGWTVLREIQKVTFAPVEQPPTVVAEVDPLAGGAKPEAEEDAQFASIVVPSAEALDRLYRPEALDVPVLVPRDGPIAALDPASVGTIPTPAQQATTGPQVTVAAAQVYGPPPPLATTTDPLGVEQALASVLGPMPADPDAVQVTTGPAPKVELVAARDAWVRVNAPDGSVIFEGVLAPGDTFELPATEEPAKLRVGDSGALYMAVNGVPYGPVGESGAVTSDVALSAEAITGSYAAADPTQNEKLAEYVAVASAEQAQSQPLPGAEAVPVELAEPALTE
jgi:cytoskeletal protein RodZ